MTLEPVSPPPPATSGKPPPPDVTAAPTPLTVSVTSATRYVGSNKAKFAGTKPGDYAGAAFASPARGPAARPGSISLLPSPCAAPAKGRFPEEGDRLIINGTVDVVKPTDPGGKQDGAMTLRYHGSTVLTAVLAAAKRPYARAGPRRPPMPARWLARADAVIEIPPGTPRHLLERGRQEPACARQHGSRSPSPGPRTARTPARA